MKRLYPLHLITFLASIFVWQPWESGKYTVDFLVKAAALHLTLMQAWFLEYTYTFNGLAWYLSITLFLYAISYPLVLFVRNRRNTVRLIVTLLVLCLSLNLYSRLHGGVNLYSSPPYRVIDYALGMLIAKQFLSSPNLCEKKANRIEISLAVLFLVQYAFSFLIGDTPGYYSVLFAISLFVFAQGKGVVSKLLSLPLFHKLASYSFEFYMMHELALRVFRKVFPEPEVFTKIGYVLRCTKISISGFMVTLICVIAYRRIQLLIHRRALHK